MTAVCNEVVERIALGEPLDDLASHVAECERCARVVAMPRQLAAAHHAVDPGLGFSARMTVAAQQRIGERRRTRIVGTLAATVAVASLAVFAVSRGKADDQMPQKQAGEFQIGPDPDPTPVKLDDAEIAGLVHLADTRRARRVSAPWRKIEKPLKPYMKLVKGVTP
jgi:hypothetical protein